MATKQLYAFGMTLNVEESVIESGFQVLDELRKEKAAPVRCLTALAQQLRLTSATATAIYVEWHNQRRPIF